MGPSSRSLTIFLSTAIVAGSVSYELCSAAYDEGSDAHGQLHSHGDYEHDHHHHHHDGADEGEHDEDHHGVDHVPVDLKATWTTHRSRPAEAPPTVPPPAACAPVAVRLGQEAACRGIPPPRAGPDPTRQLRQIRSIVLLV